jgi:hypothetical protein
MNNWIVMAQLGLCNRASYKRFGRETRIKAIILYSAFMILCLGTGETLPFNGAVTLFQL